ncbi:chalcone isomerase family protein [Chitinimonas sp. BJYL2]|uniref:chalcone isomerase family protein n=1 Tax=Chitinimonas sp. BJYL2 TaxID=2976696 RepID=UPI0022B40211|nr:chalcone isomerase family protein [Chitinimonas sp. BJYL2]
MRRPTLLMKSLRATLALCMAGTVLAATYSVNNIKFEDSAVVYGQKLVLNGASASTILSAKATVVGLYLAQKQTTPEGVAAVKGAKRIMLVALKDISSKDLGNVLVDRIRQNASQEEVNANVGQIIQIGSIFGRVPKLKKDDVVYIDWNPQLKHTQFLLNDKPLGDPMVGDSFYAMFTKVWLGPKVRAQTRNNLLGQGEPLKEAD